jgi:topoisomerase IA-like protein
MNNNEYAEYANTKWNAFKIYFIYIGKALRGTLHNDVKEVKKLAIQLLEENAKLQKKVAKKTATVSVAQKAPSKKAATKPAPKTDKDSGSK